MTRTHIIEGSGIGTIQAFYDEINRLFMGEVDWTIGASLDALNDLLYGGLGGPQTDGQERLIWKDAARSRSGLGLETTRQYYLEKLKQPEIYNVAMATAALEALERGKGKTYFELILEVIADHPNIELVLQ